jgi:ethanolamine utilization microcompartment shell protein EutS
VGIDEAVMEACKRWGQAAAIYKDTASKPAQYEVGYFEQTAGGLVFQIMGRASSLEQALSQAGIVPAR